MIQLPLTRRQRQKDLVLILARDANEQLLLESVHMPAK